MEEKLTKLVSPINNAKELMRADIRFIEFVKTIKQKRLERGIDQVKSSDRLITSLIVRHKLSPQIMEDIINFGVEDAK